ncbi:transposase [Conexibacter sp. DBS9H8]|uniref:transposase n=1 Tax=Conexibacter sp. DBS9H8 TaxID=2937801 RepID=UPI003530D8C9
MTERQQLTFARIQKLNQRLWRAYHLAQQLRDSGRVGVDDAIALLGSWLAWAGRCRLEPFVRRLSPPLPGRYHNPRFMQEIRPVSRGGSRWGGASSSCVALYTPRP